MQPSAVRRSATHYWDATQLSLSAAPASRCEKAGVTPGSPGWDGGGRRGLGQQCGVTVNVATVTCGRLQAERTVGVGR
jgi:hypothetical protein